MKAFFRVTDMETKEERYISIPWYKVELIFTAKEWDDLCNWSAVVIKGREMWKYEG